MRREHGIYNFTCPLDELRWLNVVEREYIRRGQEPARPHEMSLRKYQRQQTSSDSYRRTKLYKALGGLDSYIRSDQVGDDIVLGIVTDFEAYIKIECLGGNAWMINAGEYADDVQKRLRKHRIPFDICGELAWIRVIEQPQVKKRRIY